MATQTRPLERTLPHNLDAEKSILGAILLDETMLHRILEIIRADDFYHQGHRAIFSMMCRMSQGGRAIDHVTLNEELERAGLLERAGGLPYVAQLADGLPRTVNVEHYARIVKDRSILRELITVSQQTIEQCCDSEEEPLHLLDQAEKRIFEISEGRQRKGFVSLGELVQAGLESVEQAQKDKSGYGGVATGFQDLDELTTGLQKGDLIILAARPSMGKTSFCLNVAQHAALKLKKKVGIFSLEMSAEQLAIRMLCSEARVDSQKVRRKMVSADDWQKLVEGANRLSGATVFIDDTPGIDVLEIRAKARRMMMETGLDLLVLDYLQLMQGVGRSENRNQEVAGISRSLKSLAKELDIPLMALSQLSRAPESRSDRRPQLSDLRESGSLEQDADVVAFIFRQEVYDRTPENRGDAQLILAKQRNGPTDTIELVFINEYTRFENKAHGHESGGTDVPF